VYCTLVDGGGGGGMSGGICPGRNVRKLTDYISGIGRQESVEVDGDSTDVEDSSCSSSSSASIADEKRGA